ncbi:unnamed protein product [Dovyalis caffra]|uniref:MLO-like protein n=1 Tax=Dovyalis caffra TaxID=77055 RepID=A0AAV1R247_9ROSI|nr:unnamed protein product [Dovyalis caffra]
MAGGSGGRSLEQTPTWAVAVVCFVLVSISIIIEYIIHLIGKWLNKKRKRALYESLEKIKSELMLLGFISLLLTVGQSPISNICISKKIGATWHPCNKKEEAEMNNSEDTETDYENRRKLLSIPDSAGESFRRVLAAGSTDKCAAKGKVPFVSSDEQRSRKVQVCKRNIVWKKALKLLDEDTNSNVDSWYSYLWLPFVPLIVIITKMGLRIQERGEVVKGVPVVQPGDDLFWFNRPHLILGLINFVLFQYEFGIKSCFHEHVEDIVIRISMGVLIQILCSYVTLPLYALVTQMGSSMKPTIFNERVATALRNWHHTARKHIKQSKGSVTATPMSSRPTTPSHHTSPVHLLRYYRSEMDSLQTSPRRSNVDVEHWETESPSPSHHNHAGEGSSSHRHQQQLELALAAGHEENDKDDMETGINHNQVAAPLPQPATTHHEIEIVRKEFSFDRRSSL